MSNTSQTTKDPKSSEDLFKWVDRIFTFVKDSVDQALRKNEQELRRNEQLLHLNEQHLRHEGLRQWGTPAERRKYVQSPRTRPVPRSRSPRELS